MSKRRDALRDMMAPVSASAGAELARRDPAIPGAVKAMRMSLQSLSDDADEARILRAQLASGTQVVELDPELIDPSFIRDRLDYGDPEELQEFKESLATDGQQVPILVRPRADAEGRYQVAYGHRRLAALKALQRPVKAIVRDLSDEELIVAQGKENNERRDLSYIERALFAVRLEDHGIPRSALTSALSVHKSNLSTMIMVARSIPEDLIVAIGAAPRIGRPRWEKLAEKCVGQEDAWKRAIADPEFAASSSDRRFERILGAVSARQSSTSSRVIKAKDGKAVAQVDQGKNQVRVTINERLTPAFAAYLIEQLPDIYSAFKRRTEA